MDDDLDIELRSPADVARRAIVVSSVLHRVSLETRDNRDADDVVGEAFDLREWLVAEQLSDALTPREIRVFAAPVGEIPREERLDLSWQSEALQALLWSLDILDMPEPGLQTQIAALLDAVPQPWDRVAAWISQARLRPEEAIARERELADVWHWRVGAELAVRAASPAERSSYQQAILEVNAEAKAAGYLHDSQSSDFSVSGRAVGDLTAAELNELAAIAEERLRALNWISGFGSAWEDVPLEV